MKNMKRIVAAAMAVMMIWSNVAVSVEANDMTDSNSAAIVQEVADEVVTEPIVVEEPVNVTEPVVVEEHVDVTEPVIAEEKVVSETPTEDPIVTEEGIVTTESEDVETSMTEEVAEIEEIEEEVVEESKPKTEFAYEDSRVFITAVAKEEANLPESAELKAVYLPEGSAEYNQAVGMVEAQMGSEEKDFVDFVCYDVYFVADGVRVEPEAGTVQVTMQYKQPAFSDVQEEITDYATYHINGETSIVEDVTGTINTNSEGAVTSVGFSTESFSVIVSVAMTEPKTYDQAEKLYYRDYGLSDSTTLTTKFKIKITYKDDDGNTHVIEKEAYCLNADLGTPLVGPDGGGDNWLSVESENLEKVLYYGYGGEDDLSEQFFKENATWLKQKLGTDVFKKINSSASTRAEFFYVLTHIVASYEYYLSQNDADAEAKAYKGVNTDGKAIAEKWASYLTDQEEYGLTIWKGSKEVTSITADLEKDVTYKVTGSSKAKLTLQIPAGVKCTVTRNGQTTVYENTKVDIYAGSTITFSVAGYYSQTKNSIVTSYANETKSSLSRAVQVVAVQYDPDAHGWAKPGQDVGTLSYIGTDNVLAYSFSWQKAALQVNKTDDSGQPVSGVQFQVYNNKACSGTPLTTITTGSDGKAYLEMTVSDDIKNNKVYLKEITPDGYFDNDEVITVKLTPTGTREKTVVTQVSVVNEVFKANLKINKKDADDPTKGLAGAKFSVTCEENGYSTEVVTDAKGEAFLTGLKSGTYKVQEIQAPEGYVLNAEIKTVKIGKNATDGRIDSESYVPVYAVDVTNKAVTGTLTIQKVGEVLSSVTDGASGKVFEYTEANLAGAEFELYSTEQGEAVATLITDENGMATVDGLALGSYYLKEVKAPEGFALTEEQKNVEYPVEVEYEGQDVAVVSVDLTGESAIKNTRQKLEISVRKADADNPDIVVAGAEFALYAAEDIVIGESVVLEKDALIGTAFSDENGIAKFTQDLPLGKYYVKELQAPKGYFISDEILEYDATSPDQSVENVEMCRDFLDCKFVLKVNKSDFDGVNWIAGAEITLKATEDVFDTEGVLVYTAGEVISTWVSDGKEAKDFGPDLIGGYTYELIETNAPVGYAYAESILFTLSEDGSVTVDETVVSTDGIILIKDKALEFNVNKVDKADNSKEIAGAELTVLGKDENGEYTVVIDRWISKVGEIHDFGPKLQAGEEYILRETKAPAGYAYAADIKFAVEKDGTIVTDAKKVVDKSGRTIYLMEDRGLMNRVKTGDTNQTGRYILMFAISGALLFSMIFRKYRR